MGRLNVWISFHPPSHNLERASFFVTLLNGGKIGIYRGSMENVCACWWSDVTIVSMLMPFAAVR